jgi:hypothetical protein
VTTDRARAAQSALAIPLFNEILDELEQAAINACLTAPYDDHAKRQHNALEAMAVRKLRSRLQSIANEGQTQSRVTPA